MQSPHFHVLKLQPYIMSLPIPKVVDVHRTIPENSKALNYLDEYTSDRTSGRKSWETYNEQRMARHLITQAVENRSNKIFREQDI